VDCMAPPCHRVASSASKVRVRREGLRYNDFYGIIPSGFGRRYDDEKQGSMRREVMDAGNNVVDVVIGRDRTKSGCFILKSILNICATCLRGLLLVGGGR
jgi:hypothetical protein